MNYSLSNHFKMRSILKWGGAYIRMSLTATAPLRSKKAGKPVFFTVFYNNYLVFLWFFLFKKERLRFYAKH